MKSFEIQLASIPEIKRFVNTACSQCFDIDIISGHYVIDAKSIMGLFSLDLSRPIRVDVHGSSEEYEAFYEAVKDFVVS